MIDAESPRVARLKLRHTGVFPIEIAEDEGSVKGGEQKGRSPLLAWRRIPAKEMASATRQLSTLLGAGLPLVASLNTLIKQTRNSALRKILTQVREEVTEGEPFSSALAKFPRTFQPIYIHMIRSGELSGSMDVILFRLADLLEEQLRLKNRIQSMLAYPIFMLFIGIGVLSFLITYVIPIVTRLFTEAQQALPLPTLILITASDFLRGYGWSLGIAIFILIMAVRRFRKSEFGKELIDRAMLMTPYFGGILQKLLVARFARGVATLLQGGIPLTDALETVKAMISNKLIARDIEVAAERIREGESLAAPLDRSGHFSPLVIQMISAGEKSGSLEPMLFKAAEAHEEEVQTSLNAMISLFEPSMILFIGAIVGFIVLSVLLPILQMSQLVR
jgi:general secretion pathway protein F